MKKRNIGLIILLLICGATSGRELKYKVEDIPDSLKKNVHAVVRKLETTYSVIGPKEYLTHETIAVTVLDEKGAEYANFTEYYQPRLYEVEQVEGTLYDKDGRKVHDLKSREIVDAAGFGQNFVDDQRLKYHSFQMTTYPYTTEYTVDVRHFSTFYFNDWSPLKGEKCATQEASLTVEYPTNFPVRFKLNYLHVAPTKSVEGDKTKLSLSLNNLKFQPTDIFTPSRYSRPGSIIFATDSFILYDQPGSMASWKKYGQFVYRINDNRYELTPDIKTLVHKIADTCTSNQLKIAALYHYLQQNTRYVSIQLGIGGWQTLDAKFVCEKKYGDCKALSNFMRAMLREAGITAFPVLVSAGTIPPIPLPESFPSTCFNHVILCVPGVGDTTWLECTSQSTPPGYLSSFTANRKVLLVTPDGGFVVNTPLYNKTANVKRQHAELWLGADGVMKGKVNRKLEGMFWGSESSAVGEQMKTETEAFLNKVLGFSSYQVKNIRLSKYQKGLIPGLEEAFDVAAEGDVANSGKRTTVNTGVFAFRGLNHPQTENKHPEFELFSDFRTVDTVVIHLDRNYKLEQKPSDLAKDYPFGKVTVSYAQPDNNTIVKVIDFSVNAGEYPMSQFADYTTFYKTLLTAYNSKLLLTKEE